MSGTSQPQFDPDAFMAAQQQPATPSQAPAGGFDPAAFMASQRLASTTPPGAAIGPNPEPTSIGGKISQWAQNVADDIRYGTNLTGVGHVLNAMGAHGVYNGNPEAVGDFMASLPLGLLRTTKGAGEVAQGQVGTGAKDIGLGAWQASKIPLTFVGEPETGLVGQAGVATKAITTGQKAGGYMIDLAGNLIPSTERAAQNFQEVMGAAKDIPINVTDPGNTALRIQELSQRGSSMPKVVRDFVARVTDPAKGPLTYGEARDFYTNATRLSADEAQRLAPVMRRYVGQFTADLNRSISGAADQAGKLSQYQKAMSEYHKAMQLQAFRRGLVDVAKSTAVKAAAGAGAGAAGAYLVKSLLDSGGK